MHTSNYKTKAEAAINDPVLQGALANLQQRLGRGAAEGYRRLPEGPELSLKDHAILFRLLSLGESLCGACMPACPVNINIPRMLLLLRAKLAEGITRCMTFITGPSKTADIEATLVHGAHGPRELTIYVLTG